MLSKRKLGLTTKIVYGLSTVLILFLSSAFIGLAEAAVEVCDDPVVPNIPDNMVGSEVDQDFDYEAVRFREMWEQLQANQESYVDRWQWRKSKCRLYEHYAAWLRDHGYYDNGGGSPQSGPMDGGPVYSPMFFGPISLPSFIDMLMDIF